MVFAATHLNKILHLQLRQHLNLLYTQFLLLTGYSIVFAATHLNKILHLQLRQHLSWLELLAFFCRMHTRPTESSLVVVSTVFLCLHCMPCPALQPIKHFLASVTKAYRKVLMSQTKKGGSFATKQDSKKPRYHRIPLFQDSVKSRKFIV